MKHARPDNTPQCRGTGIGCVSLKTMKTQKNATATKSTASKTAKAAPATPAVATVAPKIGSKIGMICDLLDAVKTPAPLTMAEIVEQLTKAKAAGLISAPQNDTGSNGFKNPQTISSINAMAVPSWSRHQGRLFRYAKTTQQGEAIVNTSGETIQGIAPGARMTNTTLAHAFGPHAKAPSVISAEEWNKAGHTTPAPLAVLGELLDKQAATAKAAAKAAKAQAATPAQAPATPAPKSSKAGAPKGGAVAKAVAAIKGSAPARKRAAKAPVTQKAA